MLFSLVPYLTPTALLLGAFFLPFVYHRWRTIVGFLLAFVAFVALAFSPVGFIAPSLFLMHFPVHFLSISAFGKIYGIVFLFILLLGTLYAHYLNKRFELAFAFLYAFAALLVVLAGDVFALFLGLELMTIAAMLLILSSPHSRSSSTAMIYFITHVFGGILLIIALSTHWHVAHSFSFSSFILGSMQWYHYLFLFALLIHLALPPFSRWLLLSYPRSSYAGALFLSTYTTKATIFAVLTLFAGTSILLPIGAALTGYAVIFSLFSHNIRRVLAYSLIAQLGLLLMGVGVGTPLALSAVVAQSVVHILYSALLFMGAGVVVYRVGKWYFYELDSLYRFMPITFAFVLVGSFTSLSLPFTAGFVSKSLLSEALHDHGFFWIFLYVASALVPLHGGLRFWYLTFCNRLPVHLNHRPFIPLEAPMLMLLPMGLLAFILIILGLFPSLLLHFIGIPFKPLYTAASVSSSIQFITLSLLIALPFILYTRGRATDISLPSIPFFLTQLARFVAYFSESFGLSYRYVVLFMAVLARPLAFTSLFRLRSLSVVVMVGFISLALLSVLLFLFH